MRIAHIIDYLAESDGHAVVCLRLAAGQAEQGHVCAIGVCREPADRVRESLADGSWVSLADGRSAADAFLEEFRPDVIHLHAVWNATILHAARAAQRAGIPVVLSPHGVLAPWVLRRRWLAKRLVWWLYARACLRQVAALHALSEAEAEDLRRWGFGQPVATIPPGVDIPVLAGEAGQPCCEPADNRHIALFLSRLHPKKGVPLLLRAWASARPPGWLLVIAGPGSAREMTELQDLCTRLGLRDEVRFAGEAQGATRERLYRSANLFVLPSYTENFGLVVTEALAHGLPVIATRGTPWQELVTQRCGWWVDADVTALAEALREATQLPAASRRAMGERGCELVQERYKWAECVSRMLALYAEIAHAHE